MIVDARNREINLGSHVRYVDTGTVGEVTDSKVELLNDEDFKTKTYHDDKDIDIEAIKNSEKMFEDVEISSSAANGGG